MCHFQSSFFVKFLLLCVCGLWIHVLCFSRLLSIAEETLAEFLSKATGTAVEWVQMPGMKVVYLELLLDYLSNLSCLFIKLRNVYWKKYIF